MWGMDTLEPTALHALHAATTADLGEWEAKPTTTTPGQQERAVTLWTSADGRSEAGIWEATPGEFPSTRVGFAEVCQVLAGRVTIDSTDGASTELVAGDLFVTPEGWSGTWRVHETLRKAWVTIESR